MAIDKEAIEFHIKEILKALGDDPEREGLKDTPKRVARMYEEVFEDFCHCFGFLSMLIYLSSSNRLSRFSFLSSSLKVFGPTTLSSSSSWSFIPI